MLFNNKKALTLTTIIEIALITLAFILIIGLVKNFFGQAEDATADSICRGSVAAREAVSKQILYQKVTLAPLLCKTEQIEINKEGFFTKKNILKEIAKLTSRSWWVFGEGLVNNIFTDNHWDNSQCFIKYSFKINEGEDFKSIDSISREDFLQYMSTEPYKVSAEETKGKKYSCESKGGECVSGSCSSGTKEYLDAGWVCDQSEVCCVDENLFYTYLDYIQQFGGDGNLLVLNDKFEPGEIYGIAIISHSEIDTWFKKLTTIGGPIPTIITYENSKGKFKPTNVLVHEYDKIKEHCTVQKDISNN
jgi:hypothetical protein